VHIGILKETFLGEGRVAATPSAARALASDGWTVLVEQGAGSASGYSDDAYIQAGAEIAPTAEEVFDRCDALWKVLPPSPHEARLLRPAHTLLCLAHRLPPSVAGPVPEGVRVVDLLRSSGPDPADAPVRAAMSEIAGRLAVEAASHALQRPNGGRGLLLGGVPGVEPAEVVVLGAGVAGAGAAALAVATGASVRALDVDVSRLRQLAARLPGLRTSIATPAAVERALACADVVIAAVRDGGPVAPRVATRAHLGLLQPGSVVVDLSVTDGGAFASTPLTDLESPVVEVDGIAHIGVPNFPGAVPRTSSAALSQAALPAVRGALRA
jgi:alanine dehydrogenase